MYLRALVCGSSSSIKRIWTESRHGCQSDGLAVISFHLEVQAGMLVQSPL